MNREVRPTAGCAADKSGHGGGGHGKRREPENKEEKVEIKEENKWKKRYSDQVCVQSYALRRDAALVKGLLLEEFIT
eukprot:747184-Hanusia_phi.AAC.1